MIVFRDLLLIEIMVCVLLENRFFHLFSYTTASMVLLMFMIIITWLSSLYVHNRGGNFADKYMLSVLIFVIVPQWIYTSLMGQPINDFIGGNAYLVSIILLRPICIVLQSDNMEMVVEKILNIVLVLLVLVIINYMFRSFRGTSIWNSDYYAQSLGERYGRIRMALSTPFLALSTLYSFWSSFFQTKNKKRHIIQALISLFVVIVIDQTRMLVIAIVMGCIAIGLYYIKKNVYKVLVSLLAVIIGISGIMGGALDKILAIFSIYNSDNGQSTLRRIFEINYAIDIIRENLILGQGMLKEHTIPVYWRNMRFVYNHTDLGLLGTIAYIGILGTIFLFIIPLIRYICLIKKVRNNKKYFPLYMGLLIYIFLTSFTVIITDNVRVFAWPFIMGIMEYIVSFEVIVGNKRLFKEKL